MSNKHGLSDEQIALLKNPTMEGAMKLWNYALLGKPLGDAPLAGVHKARLKWPGSSKAMVQESKKWLRENGYGADPRGPDPNAPMAQRIKPQ